MSEIVAVRRRVTCLLIRDTAESVIWIFALKINYQLCELMISAEVINRIL